MFFAKAPVAAGSHEEGRGDPLQRILAELPIETGSVILRGRGGTVPTG